MNATLARVKQSQTASSADAEAKFERLAVQVADDIAPTDAGDIHRILADAGKTVEDLEQRVALIGRRQKWRDEMAAAERDRIAADDLGHEYEAVAAELKRVSEPLRAKLNDIARRKESLGKSTVRAAGHFSRLAETAPAWIAEERRAAGQRLTAARERLPFVREGIAAREQRLTAIQRERAEAAAKIKPVTHPERIGRDEQDLANKQAESKIEMLDRERADVTGQLEQLRAELPTVEQECRRLERRVSLLSRQAGELWPIRSDFEELLLTEG